MPMDGIIHDTQVGLHKHVHMSGLERMVVQRTGLPAGTPTMEGIIANTKHAIPNKNVPELHKVAAGHRSKTHSKSMGQVPYAGKMY